MLMLQNGFIFYPSLKLLFFYFPIFHVFKLFVRLVTVLRIVTLTFDLAKGSCLRHIVLS